MQMKDSIYGQNRNLSDESDGIEAETAGKAVLGVMIWQYKWCNLQMMKETAEKDENSCLSWP